MDKKRKIPNKSEKKVTHEVPFEGGKRQKKEKRQGLHLYIQKFIQYWWPI
jgi:hypothetical protein